MYTNYTTLSNQVLTHDWAGCGYDWAGCGRLATCFRSTRTKVKTQGAVTAVDGNKRGDLELVSYIGDGAQDLVLDHSFRPRHWHRNGELINTSNPDKDLVEKAARKIAKYRELYREHHRKLHFLPPSPAPLGEPTTSCCDCCSYTRTGRRRASSRL